MEQRRESLHGHSPATSTSPSSPSAEPDATTGRRHFRSSAERALPTGPDQAHHVQLGALRNRGAIDIGFGHGTRFSLTEDTANSFDGTSRVHLTRVASSGTLHGMQAERTARATSFGAWADRYDDCRPSYPSTAVAWLINDARRIVEAGAGTGKLTDRLVEHPEVSLDVTEIDGRMLRLIRARHPTLPVHETSGSALPCDDGSIDSVLVADAWQWFPKEEAAAELRRVLRPGGWLGCVWNDMSISTPDWQWAAMRLDAAIADDVRDMAPLERLGLASGQAEQQAFPWRWVLTPNQWRGYVSTLSHVQTLPPQERHEALALAERLAAEACDEAGTPTVNVHFDAVCIRWLPS